MRSDRPSGPVTGQSGGGCARPGVGGRRVVCVLWVARGVAAPADLEHELERKGIEHELCDNAHGVMAVLCAMRGGEEGRPVRVVVLVEPEMLPDARELLGGLDRYASDVARWVYRRGANPSLRALVESDVPRTSQLRETPPVSAGVRSAGFVFGGSPRPERRPLAPRDAASGRPSLRLTDHPSVASARPDRGGGEVVDDGLGDVLGPDGSVESPDARTGERASSGSGASSVLTDEELAMLLGDEPGSSARPRRGPDSKRSARGEEP